ncbi:MAG: hypothetical protein RLO52_30585 [Sandaracinaceae bacterium]
MSSSESRSGLSRRRFLVATSGALAGAACSSMGLGDDGGLGVDGGRGADGGPGVDGGLGADGGPVDPDDAGSPDSGVGPSWLLPEGHYEGYFPLHVIYPRPDAETESYARHRHAHPGVLYEIPIGVQFGKWPYRYELVEGPPGARVVHETLEWNGADAFVTPEGYGVVAWDVPAAAAGTHGFVVRVYDQDHGRSGDSFVDVEWTTTVGTSQFIFLDTVGGDDASADGSIDAPFRELAALQDSGRAGDKICYIRETEHFDPDHSRFAGGYTPSPPRQLTFGDADHPKAYVAFPGETVHVNTAGQRGFAQSTEVNHDVFFDRIVNGYTNQSARNRDNIRVVMHWQKSHRSTFWRMGCIRAFGGTRKDDNHGFIWYWNAGGDVDDQTGHSYLYAADCWMDHMNVDPGPSASFDGVGSNGPHLWETYTTNYTLAERLRVSNSHVVNNGFVIVKGSARDAEIRGCVTVEGNRGQYHVRGLGSNTNGETRRVALCFNKTGGDEARVSMGQAGSNPPYEAIIAYRNSCSGGITAASNPAAASQAHNNVARAISDDVKESSGNVDHAGSVGAFFDGEMNLIGEARAMYLGTKGAEIA